MKLSIIIPTYNESKNVKPLIEVISSTLQALDYEIIFVDDDSPDGTAKVIKEISATNPNVRCLHRIGRRGLASAVIEGFCLSHAEYLAVIDGDLQHDEKILPLMVEKLDSEALDIVVGSRFTKGGDIQDFSAFRAMGSRAANWLAQTVAKARLTDPMSGFFMVKRSVFEDVAPALSGRGFKILIDIFASASRPLEFREIGYKFNKRTEGQSKMSPFVVFDYLMMLWDKKFGAYLSAKFLIFCLVGSTGLGVHIATLFVSFKVLELPFIIAQSLAVLIAMTNNFILNNSLTFRDEKLHKLAKLKGLLSFYVICGLGALANIGVANAFFSAMQTQSDPHSWAFAGIAGAIVGALWNYVVSSRYTWGRRS